MKPRIYRRGAFWYCTAWFGSFGCGRTPMEAYKDWCNNPPYYARLHEDEATRNVENRA